MAQKATLVIKDKVRDRNDSLAWQWLRGSPTAKSEFGAPDLATEYGLCVYDSAPPRLVLSAEVPGGRLCGAKRPKSCWRRTRAGFTFKDGNGISDGVRSILFKGGAAPGRAKIALVAKGAPLHLPSPLALVPPVTVQLVTSAGQCWEATYGSPAESEPSRFKAKAD